MTQVRVQSADIRGLLQGRAHVAPWLKRLAVLLVCDPSRNASGFKSRRGILTYVGSGGFEGLWVLLIDGLKKDLGALKF